MDQRTTVAELDNMIDRISLELALKRSRLKSMPDTPSRQEETHHVRTIQEQLYRLRTFRKAVTAHRAPGSLLH